MKRILLLCVLLSGLFAATLRAQTAFEEKRTIAGPDGKIAVTIGTADGKPCYTVDYDGKPFLLASPLGLLTDLADYRSSVTLDLQSVTVQEVQRRYTVPTLKARTVDVAGVEAVLPFLQEGRRVFDVILWVTDRDVAFRYKLYPTKNRLCCVVKEEATGFVLPEQTTTFLCPYSAPMTGFARTAPSYETPYAVDAPMGRNGWGYGYTLPCLFRNGDAGWLQISETEVDGSYCGSHLANVADNRYAIAFPPAGEFNGNATSAPGLSLPGVTPWRTITLGATLAPLAETTVACDVVEPRYEASRDYVYGRGTWSWIIAGDSSMNYDVQRRYIDFAADMGYESVLVDAFWDVNVGRERIAELARYAAGKGVGLYLWYNSNGYWNDAPQSPKHRMDKPIARHAEMRWMRDTGIRGIKVDFFGSDKQQTMQLYEDILCDANEYGLAVIFHGCTLPRGWERMYPNFLACEAVLASENLNFSQGSCDAEAFNATIHPLCRNAVGSMDFGGSALNRYYNAANEPRGSRRVTSEVFALATAILFQSPVQHFALAPNNLTDAPAWAVDFMKQVPTLWDEVRFLEGYPGRYLIMARRTGDRWYVAGVNAAKEPVEVKLPLGMFAAGQTVRCYTDDKALNGSVASVRVPKSQQMTLRIPTNGGVVICN